MATFTRTAAQIEEIHNTVSNPSTNQAFTDAIGEQVIPKYTDMVFDSVASMISDAPVGAVCQVKATSYKRDSSSSGDISDFTNQTNEEAKNLEQDGRLSSIELEIMNQSSGVYGYPTQAAMNADLNPDDGAIAYVTNDTTATNNGTYRKSGASGSGSWIQSSQDLSSQAYQLAKQNELIKATLETIGKNKINTSDVTIGKYIDFNTGSELSASGFSSTGYIELLPNKYYTLSTFTGSNQQFALYDSTKTFTEGFAGSGSEYNFTTGASSVFGRFTIQDGSTGNQLEIGGKSDFEEYQIGISESSIGNETVTKEKVKPDSGVIVSSVGKNKININDLTDNKYVDFTNGILFTNNDYKSTGFIDLIPDTEYTLSVSSGSTVQFALYDSNKVYSTGNAAGGQAFTFTTGADVFFGRFSLINTASEYQLEVGVKTPFNDYQEGIVNHDLTDESVSFEKIDYNLKQLIGSNETNITLGDGFSTIRECVEYANSLATIDSPVNINIPEGSYSVLQDYSSAEINSTSFYGVPVGDHVSMTAIGNRENTIIVGFLDGTFSSSTQERVSTLDRKGSGKLKGLTVLSKNIRYSLHDDRNSPESVIENTDCLFIKQESDAGQYSTSYAVGIGGWSGSMMKYNDCDFRNENPINAGAVFFWHNIASQSKPAKLKLNNCNSNTVNGERTYEIFGLGSGQNDRIEFNNCRGNGRVQMRDDAGELTIVGHGNDQFIVDRQNDNTSYNFQGEHLKLVNKGSYMNMGTPVKFANSGVGIEPMGTSDSSALFLGVTEQNVNTDEQCNVRISGFMDTNRTPLTVSQGDKVGVVSGDLAVVSSGEIVGIAKTDRYILLK